MEITNNLAELDQMSAKELVEAAKKGIHADFNGVVKYGNAWKMLDCSTGSAGVRCPWRFAPLYYGGYAGLAAEHGYIAPGNSAWDGRPRLCGAGKKRGEWSA